MAWMVGLVAALVVLGSALAIAESSISRMTRIRALALKGEGRRNAALLEEIERDPPKYLNPVYLAVMFVQNGSAILVALLAEQYFADLGITVASVAFTIGYFVLVEAMSKTFAIQNSDRAALIMAPVVWLLARLLAWPTRALIGLANVLLPGRGLVHGPFVSEEDIRSMADVGHEEGGIEESEKELIHSVFHFRDRLVRELMVPRPDVVGLDLEHGSLHEAQALLVHHGVTRVPAYREGIDHTEGILHAKDVLNALLHGHDPASVTSLLRPAHFVPASKRAADLLRDMQQEKFHVALVTDEYGAVVGLVTLEDLLEQLVGDIGEEHDAREIEPLGDGRYRVDASVTIHELSELLGTELPHDRWNTVGGLMFGLSGSIPVEGESVATAGFRFTAERVQGRRVTMVLVALDETAAGPAEG